MANTPLPPLNLEAEEHLLGAMMLANAAIEAALDLGIKREDFYRQSHGLIFDAIMALYGEGKQPEPIIVVDKLISFGTLPEAGGANRIRDIATVVPVAGQARHHAEIVLRTSVLRATVNAGIKIAQLGQSAEGELHEILDRVESIVLDLGHRRSRSDFVPTAETVPEALGSIDAGGEALGLASGFECIDRLTAGFQPGNLIVIGARPSMGKTGFALCMAANVGLRSHLPVAIFSLEMNKGEVTQRLLSAEALVEAQKIRTGALSIEERERLQAAGSRLSNAQIFIDDSADLTAIELRSKARKLALRHPDLALVVVDYIQLMTSGQRFDNRVQDVSATSRALKVLAADLGVPVVALSQLSRGVEARHDKRPQLSDLRETGAIEQDADVVGFLYRDEYYNPDDTDQAGIAEFDIAKHRTGPTSMVKLAFVKRFVRFSELPRPGAGDTY